MGTRFAIEAAVAAIAITIMAALALLLIEDRRALQQLRQDVNNLSQQVSQLEYRPAVDATAFEEPAITAMSPTPAAPVVEEEVETATATLRPELDAGRIRQIRDESVPLPERLALAREMLNSPMPFERFAAVGTLIEANDAEALNAVRTLVAEAEGSRRLSGIAARAVDGLAGLSDPSTDRLLYEYIDSGSDAIRYAAARALDSRGDSSPMGAIVSDLSQQLADEDGGIRSRSARSLGFTRNAMAVAPLLNATSDANSEVRLRAAEALGRIGGDDAVPHLTQLLDDPVEAVRDSADRSLERIRRADSEADQFSRFIGF